MDGRPAGRGEHPDPDLLADLAAQVLAPDLSTRIEAHVLSCGYCAGLLAEAEGLQAALRGLSPEPMPADIGQRLERVLASEVQAIRAGTSSAALPATPAAGTSAGNQRRAADATGSTTGPLPTRRSLREGGRNTGEIKTTGETPRTSGEPSRTSGIGTGSIQTSGLGTGAVPIGAGAAGASGAPAGPAAGSTGSTGRIRIGQGQDRPAQVSRLRRVTSSRTGARRQSLEEQRSDRPSRISQLMPVLRVAAGVVLVVGVGALGIRLVQHAGGGDAASSADSGTVTAAGAPVLTPVQETGTNYTKDSLSSQVKSLVGRTQTQAQSSATKAAPAQPLAGTGSPQAPEAASSDASGNLLQSSAALRSCLTGIGEPDAQPVAVDLARYDDRDAAILVIPADDGSYSVWVVARNCTAQDDGTLAVVTVKP